MSSGKTLFEMLLAAKDPETGKELSDEVIRDNVITFLFAGHDTTAHSMAFTVYELTQNPPVLRRLQEELDRVLGDNDIPDANQLKDLEYLDMVIKVRNYRGICKSDTCHIFFTATKEQNTP